LRPSIYGWIKAFHIIAVIAWMAGMLYLPRLFVYHCAAEKGSVQSETFKVMERRRVILGAQRIGFVVNDVEARLFEQWTTGVGEFDVEIIRDIDYGDLVPDLAAVLQFLEHVDRTLCIICCRRVE
jgi:hypothetical protein